MIDLEKLKGEDPLALKPSPRPPMGVVNHEGNLTRRASDSDPAGFSRRSRLKAPPP